VSGDFNSNPVSLFLIPLLDRHDRIAYEVYCYSVGMTVDDFTSQVQSRQVIWREVASMSSTDLADAINRDGIDILVDLSGHSRESRLVVFAQQPAPVQVTWLGYLSTTGMTRMQYRLCDRRTDPPGTAEQYHTETLVRLPHIQWCYRPRVSIDYSCPSLPPFTKSGHITFGSFNDAIKLSPSALRLWAEILKALPDSRLLLVGIPDGHCRDRLVRYFEESGIVKTRVTMAARTALQEYFRLFSAVDIALDTTPYSGGTTTCDTLWMGVPVITVPGSRPVSRSTASILSCVGLTECIALTPEDYVRRAVRLAGEREALTELRGTLRQRMGESPLMDEIGFARDIEDAYRQMWRAWCSGAERFAATVTTSKGTSQ
jgi:predicted O-linked N-acetylglucosamine transferase (SPINDLY family)